MKGYPTLYLVTEILFGNGDFIELPDFQRIALQVVGLLNGFDCGAVVMRQVDQYVTTAGAVHDVMDRWG